MINHRALHSTVSNVLSLTFHVLMSTVGYKKKSKVPGVMITQYIETLPEGMSHPDFTRKPIALTIQEGKTDGGFKYLNHKIFRGEPSVILHNGLDP